MSQYQSGYYLNEDRISTMKSQKTRFESDKDIISDDIKEQSYADDFFKRTAIPPTTIIKSTVNKPTPLDFGAFVPWACGEWQCPVTVTIIKAFDEDFTKTGLRMLSSKSTRSSRTKYVGIQDSYKSLTTFKSTIKKVQYSSDTVPLKVYYAQGSLVEISIIGYHTAIDRKVIQAIGFCLPFHSYLTKLTIGKGGLDSVTLYEISKLLPHSNLTDVCLDGSSVREQNYYILLEHKSPLKSLSLNKCNISDWACEQIVAKLDIGCTGDSLATLELSFNLITDKGALVLGDVLRRNRSLLHLNLLGNKITDTGAFAILSHLMEFPLTANEILAMRSRKIEFINKKLVVFYRCLEEINKEHFQKQSEILAVKSFTKKSPKKPPTSTPKHKKRGTTVSKIWISRALAEAKATEIMGEFMDPFNSANVVQRVGCHYCIGNMTLCSLNLAYNNLEYPSIQMLKKVLKYQEQLVLPDGTTGLMRALIAGNNIPKSCLDYFKIDYYLSNVISRLLPQMTQKKRIQKKL